MENNNTKYCKFCGAIIPADALFAHIAADR